MNTAESFVARLLRELADELEWFWFADEFQAHLDAPATPEPVEWPMIPTGESPWAGQ